MGSADLALWLLVGLLLMGWVWLYTRHSTLEAPKREPEPSSDVPVDELRPGNDLLQVIAEAVVDPGPVLDQLPATAAPLRIAIVRPGVGEV